MIDSGKVKSYEPLIASEVEKAYANSRFYQTAFFLQHGGISVHQHCVSVAYLSCWIAWRLHLKVEYSSLIRGALLHDYFLYDWHDKDSSHKLHGFHHAKTALKNASLDFELTEIEKDIIAKHMFPLNIKLPKYRESYIVTLADKICSSYEVLYGNACFAV